MRKQRIIKSSTQGFDLFENFKPVQSHVAVKKHAMAERVQEQSSNVGNNNLTNKKIPNKVAAIIDAKVKRPSAKPEQSEKVVFIFGSPIREENILPDCNSGKNYTEICAWPDCKKDIIAGKHDAYMYGYLQAYCSEECRNKQIDLDEKSKASCRRDAKEPGIVNQWYNQRLQQKQLAKSIFWDI